jgi:hypothetical protein
MPTLAGPRRGPRHARWPRRVAGMLGTGALLAIGVAIAVMILPGAKTAPSIVAGETTPTATPHARSQAHHGTGLTAAQKRARAAAVAAVRGQGYVPVRLADYNPRHQLRVLIGAQSGNPVGPRRAFFFAGGHYVGSDSTTPSSGLKVSGSGAHWVTLSYGIYASGDGACCPSGGHAKVRYEWSGTTVSPVGGTIPTSSQRVAP